MQKSTASGDLPFTHSSCNFFFSRTQVLFLFASGRSLWARYIFFSSLFFVTFSLSLLLFYIKPCSVHSRIFSGMCATNRLWEREREWGRCGYCCQLSNACLNKPPGGCANKDYSKHLSSSLKTHTQCTAAHNTKQMYICWRVSSWICLESIWICGCIKLNSSVIPLHWTIAVFWSSAD